jgi:hypothetical protein
MIANLYTGSLRKRVTEDLNGKLRGEKGHSSPQITVKRVIITGLPQ